VEYAIEVVTDELLTVMLPDDVDGRYCTPVPPETEAAVLQEYVPGETSLMVMFAGAVPEYGLPLNTTDQLVPDGRPASVNVTDGQSTKFAVTDPGPPMVAVVEELVADAKVIDVVDAVHDAKEYPGLADAPIVSEAPELTQVLVPAVGDVVPPALAAIVT